MCCCEKPNKNGEAGYSLDGKAAGTRQPSPPRVPEGWTIIYDEPGRCGPMGVRVDHHSHHYRVVKDDAGSVHLIVQHGGGREELGGHYYAAKLARVLALLPDSDARFLALMSFDGAIAEARIEARESEAHRWRAAIADGRARKRRYPKRGHTKVWIEEGPRVYDVMAGPA